MTREPVLYPKLYPWFVLLASLDVLLTWFMLSPSIGAIELNPIAAHLIAQGGITAATFFKYATVTFVILSTEYIGRRDPDIGRRLLWIALAVNCAVVSASIGQIGALQILTWG